MGCHFLLGIPPILEYNHYGVCPSDCDLNLDHHYGECHKLPLDHSLIGSVDNISHKHIAVFNSSIDLFVVLEMDSGVSMYTCIYIDAFLLHRKTPDLQSGMIEMLSLMWVI